MTLPVVPNAFGFGMDTRAAYGSVTSPIIIRVTNVNDSGAGSLRAAIEGNLPPRVVIFETSGTIVQQSDFTVTSPYLTIAGQTAPFPGIQTRSATSTSQSAGGINVFTHDVLIQHLVIRPGDGGPNLAQTAAHDGILVWTTGGNQGYNVVFDHCTVGWAGDKNYNLVPGIPANITLWRCISHEALFYASNVTISPNQPSSLGCLIGGTSDGGNVDIIQSIFAHCSDRNPEIHQNTNVHLLNNIFYDFGQDNKPPGYQWATLFYGPGAGAWKANIQGNTYIAGPATPPLQPLYAVGTYSGDSASQLYENDNALDQTKFGITADYNNMSPNPRVGSPAISNTGYTILSNAAAKTLVLSQAGARPTERDTATQRIINDINNYTGGIISSQNSVGGWPTYAVNTRALTTPANPNADSGNGYTNLEVWLHGYANSLEGGSQTITPSAVTNTWVIPNVTPVGGPITLHPTAVSTNWVIPSVILKTSLQSPSAVTANWNIPTVTVALGPPITGTSDVVSGSLLFSSYGDFTAKFYSPAGVLLGDPPGGALQLDRFCDGIVSIGSSNKYAMVGGGDITTPGGPKFPTTGVGIFSFDFSSWVEGASGAHGFPGRSMARDSSNHFYAVGTGNKYIFKYASDGTQINAWNTGQTDNLTTLGVNAAGTVGYYSLDRLGSNPDKVYAWDLSGDTDLGAFVTNTGYYILGFNAILCSGSDVLVGWSKTADTGYIKHYNSGGSTLHTYTLSGTNSSPIVLTPGIAGTSFWVGYYNDDAITFSTITISEIELGTGNVLNTFDPDNGSFEFDSPFCVITEDLGISPTITGQVIFSIKGPTITATGLVPGNRSGIYYIKVNKRNDTLFIDPISGTTTTAKIPDPFGITGLLGD